MAEPNENLSLLVTGQLAYGCTDLTAEWPHGGTGLGLVGSIYWQPPSAHVRLPAEEDGATRAVIYTGGDGVLGASVEGWDDSASGGVLAPLFPRTDLNADGTRTVIRWSTEDAGTKLAELSNLVFTPLNPEHPALWLPKVVVLLEASAQLRLGSYRYLSVPILAVAVPNDDGIVGVMGRLADIAPEVTP